MQSILLPAFWLLRKSVALPQSYRIRIGARTQASRSSTSLADGIHWRPDFCETQKLWSYRKTTDGVNVMTDESGRRWGNKYDVEW